MLYANATNHVIFIKKQATTTWIRHISELCPWVSFREETIDDRAIYAQHATCHEVSVAA